MHYLLTYHYTDDYIERRPQFRDAHLRHAWAAQQRGELFLGGAAGDPPDCAVLIFQCDDVQTLERFVQADPYYVNGLVRHYTIQPWTTVVGEHATTPIRPAEVV